MENYIHNGNFNNLYLSLNSFPKDINSYEYQKINKIRSNLLKLTDKEVSIYIKNKTKINSKTTLTYMKSFLINMTIKLKTIRIMSSQESGTSFISKDSIIYEQKIINTYFNPFLLKNYHHYHEFKFKKKLLLSKNISNNKKFDSRYCLNSPNSIEYSYSPNRERHLFELTKKIRKKTYFNYLQSLFISYHKPFYQTIEQPKKYESSNLNNISNVFQKYKKYKRRNSPKILKIKHNMDNIKTGINKNDLIKSSSNDDIFNVKVINLIKCKKEKKSDLLIYSNK